MGRVVVVLVVKASRPSKIFGIGVLTSDTGKVDIGRLVVVAVELNQPSKVFGCWIAHRRQQEVG